MKASASFDSQARSPQSAKGSMPILVVVFLTVFIDLVGFGIIIPLSPFLATRFGAGAVDVGRLMAAYSLMQFLFNPVWGRLSDKFGRRPIILISVLGAAISHAAFAFADSLAVLYAARIFAGIFGANISTAMAAIADVSAPKDRSKNMGLVGAAFGLGFIFGPVLGFAGGWLGQGLGSHPPFGMSFGAVLASALCFLNFALASYGLRETLSSEIRSRLSPRQSRWALVWRFLHRPVVNYLIIVYFFASLAMSLMEPMMFLYVKNKFNWGFEAASLGFAYVGLVMVFTQGFLIRRLMPRFGERRVMIAGLVLAGLGLAGIGLSNSLLQMFLVVTCLGLGTGMVNPSITGSVSLLSREDEQGLIIGVTQSMASLARIVGPEFSGHLYATAISLPFLTAGAVTWIGLAIALLVYRQIPQVSQQ